MAQSQAGLITRSQLRAAGVRSQAVAHRIARERWQALSPKVMATFTGEPSELQRLWLGVLHAGDGSLVAGLHAAELDGLKNWHREDITVLVPAALAVPRPLPGYRFIRSTRDLTAIRSRTAPVPACRAAIAVLLWASGQRNDRVIRGVLAAMVQQRRSTPATLLRELESLGRVPHASTMRSTLIQISGGAQSTAELDVRRMCRAARIALPARQVKRYDADGRARFTDCEWPLPGGRVLVLEVDGSFHMEVEHWEDDIARQRALSAAGRIVVRCTANELRDRPEQVARDLVRLGVPRAA